MKIKNNQNKDQKLAHGTKIRNARMKIGLTLKQLSKKVGISALTLQRIETGKTSPSVVLLSEIAQVLDKPISSFIEENYKPVIHIKKQNQRKISNPMLEIQIIGPRKMIKDNIVVTYGKLKKGQSIDSHTNLGTEWAFNIEGKCVLKLDNETYTSEAGDSIAFNAKVEHSITALEDLNFLFYLR